MEYVNNLYYISKMTLIVIEIRDLALQPSWSLT